MTTPQASPIYQLFPVAGDVPPGSVPLSAVYADLGWPAGIRLAPPAASSGIRPYVAINMVSTVDGKVVVGRPGTTHLIGSDVDHTLMKRINRHADAILVGAGTLRADGMSYPALPPAVRAQRQQRGLRAEPLRIAVSSRGQVPLTARFFQAPREHLAVAVSPAAASEHLTSLRVRAQVIPAPAAAGDSAALDARALMSKLAQELGIRRLVCLGGPRTNAWLIEAGLVDELFVTIAPKVQGGTGMSTAVEGQGFPANALAQLDLRSVYHAGSELFLRYRFRR